MLAPLLLQSTLFVVTLTLAVAKGGFFWGALYFGFALYWYFRSPFDRDTFLYSFFVLTLYAYLVASFLYRATEASGSPGMPSVVLVAAFFGVLFFLLLGIKEFVLLRRQAIFNALSGALYFFVSGMFFAVDKSSADTFILHSLLSAATFYLLIRESIDFFMEDSPRRKKDVLAIGFTLLVAEFFSIASMLPVGFLNSAALIVLIVFVLEDLAYYHLKGTLDRQIVLNNATILIVCLLFIFATSKLTL